MADNSKNCLLWLTCASKEEASKITTILLEKKLIACARQIDVSSDFLWKGKVEHSNEVMLMMESAQHLFAAVEAEVAKLHSYDTFVLTASELTNVSRQAQKWLRTELSGK